MNFKLSFTERAKTQFNLIKDNPALLKRLKSASKSLGYLQTNPRHPSLNTHKYSALSGPNSEEIFEAYAENNTSGAYRIFWHYGPGKDNITIIAITAHP